jgi:hypothetical protein
MADELERLLAGLDGPRPLPAAVRARLEATVMSAVAPGGAAPAPATAAGEPMPVQEPPAEPLSTGLALDSPRPLPSPLQARLEEAVMAAAAGPASATPAGEVPAGWGSTAPTVILRPSRRRRSARFVQAMAAAAVLALVLGVVATLGGHVGPGQRDDGREVAAGGPHTSATGITVTNPNPGETAPTTSGTVSPASPPGRTARPGSPGLRATAPGQAETSSGSDTASNAPPSAGESRSGPPAMTANPEKSQPSPSAGADSDAEDRGPAPPYAHAGDGSSDEAPAAAYAPGPGSPGRSQSPSGSSRPPLRIGVVGGDAAQEAGFRSYVELLNRAGGVRGRALELVPTGPGKPAGGAVVTVNLSPRPIAGPGGPPPWAAGPVLETLTATEPVLRGSVFGFASAPERQGHLVADAVFPEPAKGSSAVIYRASDGPLADAVPQAIERVLAERGVKVRVELYDPVTPPLLHPADAAFLSLEPEAARSFLRQAEASGYRPERGLAGVYSLFEPSLLSKLPGGTRVVSPYVVPPGEEAEAIHSSAKGTGVGVLHGWATAKSLAVALWRSGAQSADQVTAALEGLAGYDSGLAPPYEVRSGTRSRTPEGALHEVRSGAFSRTGGFRRDPY